MATLEYRPTLRRQMFGFLGFLMEASLPPYRYIDSYTEASMSPYRYLYRVSGSCHIPISPCRAKFVTDRTKFVPGRTKFIEHYVITSSNVFIAQPIYLYKLICLAPDQRGSFSEFVKWLYVFALRCNKG